jgi:methyl-accepting chemotaxis protein
MKMSFQNKILAAVFGASVLCTVAAIVVARMEISKITLEDTVAKSAAILSRLEVGRDYIASMGTLAPLIEDAVRKYPDGNLPKEAKERILKSVPIFASFQLGNTGAEKELYKFRIFAESPRNKENTPTQEEVAILQELKATKSAQLVRKTDGGANLMVIRPVYLDAKQGCISCHGDPATSPWKNGKDVLGRQMENMKDGDLRAAFSIITSLSATDEQSQAAKMNATRNIVLAGLGFTLLSMLIAYFIVRIPVRGLGVVVDGVASASSQVNSASAQLSSGASAMAEGASEQAASMEETSSTLEQMANSTATSARSAQEAQTLAMGARDLATEGGKTMTRMSAAIGEIKSSADKTARIVKTIDEIAFQTNLLALNAAVEAARAGDAGRGFAVVAEEVRNLAQRSAQAAKETSALIEDSQTRAEQGVKVSEEMGALLEKINQSVQKSADLIHGLAEASREQANSISQVNAAVSQMDTVTQSNAANAEQSAAASEELAAQASELGQLVAQMANIVGTSANGKTQAAQGHSVARANPTARLEKGAPGNGAAIPKGGSLRSRIVADRHPAGPAEPKTGEFRDL